MDTGKIVDKLIESLIDEPRRKRFRLKARFTEANRRVSQFGSECNDQLKVGSRNKHYANRPSEPQLFGIRKCNCDFSQYPSSCYSAELAILQNAE